MAATALYESSLPHLTLRNRGKVRDIYELDAGHLLIVTTVRRSAFDVVLPQPIPGKGEVLIRVSNFWFGRTRAIIPNHLSDRPLAEAIPRGGSLENAIVVDDEGILNPEGLRFPDEFVRHKILDAIGDLSLLGYPLLGHVRAYKAGPDINHQLVKKILANPHCWQLLEFPEEHLQEALRVPLPDFSPELALSRA